MIMSLVQMGSGGEQGGDAVSVQILVFRIGLLFIVNSVSSSSLMTGWGLVRESIGSVGANASMIAGEGVSHRECNIFRFFGTGLTYT